MVEANTRIESPSHVSLKFEFKCSSMLSSPSRLDTAHLTLPADFLSKSRDIACDRAKLLECGPSKYSIELT
jgi:hypothetical protein